MRSLLFSLFILLTIASCKEKVPDIPEKYFGHWNAEEQKITWLVPRQHILILNKNGDSHYSTTGAFQISDEETSGAAAIVQVSSLRVGNKVFKIDTVPTTQPDNNITMYLDGFMYTKQ